MDDASGPWGNLGVVRVARKIPKEVGLGGCIHVEAVLQWHQ